VVVAATILCGITDVWRFKVYNAVTLPLLCGGLAYHALAPAGEKFGFAVVGTVVGGALLLPVCALGGVGAGDVKLLAAIGAWVGARDVLVIFIVTAVLVGLYSSCVIALTADWRGMPARIRDAVSQPHAVRALFRNRAKVDEVMEQAPGLRRRRLVPMASIMAVAELMLMMSQSLRETS
jgi:prepilin peptidase CpaA